MRSVSVPLALLGLLEQSPSHGYDLKRDYDLYFGRGKPLPFGQVYSTLGRLARDGKVVAADSEPGAGPDRKRYVITDDGVSDLETWLSSPVAPEPHLQTVLFVKVVLALMSGRPAEEYLDVQRAAHMARMRELTELRRSTSLVDALLADHAPVPPRSGPALDRPDRVPPQRPRGGGAGVTVTQPDAAAVDAEPLLRAEDVSLSFGATPALRGASVTIERGNCSP